MTVKEAQTDIVKLSEKMAREIIKGNDISITKTSNGLKVMSENKKTIR